MSSRWRGEGDDSAVGPAGEKDRDLRVRAVIGGALLEVCPDPPLSCV